MGTPTMESFLKDVSQHQMRVLRNDGLYRNLVFSRPDTVIQSFGITTWPGHLCYYGDMGTNVFSRKPDMFEFHRGEDLQISMHYWAEKLQAVDCRRTNPGYEEFCPDRFEAAVKSDFDEYVRHGSITAEDAERLWEDIQKTVIPAADDGEQKAYEATMSYRVNDQYLFPDFSEHSCRSLTFRFVWCCYAIRWAIQQYDAWEKNQ